MTASNRNSVLVAMGSALAVAASGPRLRAAALELLRPQLDVAILLRFVQQHDSEVLIVIHVTYFAYSMESKSEKGGPFNLASTE